MKSQDAYNISIVIKGNPEKEFYHISLYRPEASPIVIDRLVATNKCKTLSDLPKMLNELISKINEGGL